MVKVYLDSEPFEGKEALQEALAPLASSDMPLTFELLFVTEEEIRSLNARTRGVDKVTDVLSFPSMELERGKDISSEEHGECVEPWEEGEETFDTLFCGSIVICEKRAEEQAEEYGHSLARERTYLAVHGVLHCLGYDHMEEGEKREMRAKEEEVMERLNLGRGA